MRFDTLLKLGTHAAKIIQHDSFQEMSKMIHKGVKRRTADPQHWLNGPQLPYSPDRFTRHHDRFGPLPPYGNARGNAGGNARSQGANPAPQSQAGTGPWKDLLTPNNLQLMGQLLKGFTDRGNNQK